jgi:hypothetical protein
MSIMALDYASMIFHHCVARGARLGVEDAGPPMSGCVTATEGTLSFRSIRA